MFAAGFVEILPLSTEIPRHALTDGRTTDGQPESTMPPLPVVGEGIVATMLRVGGVFGGFPGGIFSAQPGRVSVTYAIVRCFFPAD